MPKKRKPMMHLGFEEPKGMRTAGRPKGGGKTPRKGYGRKK